VFLLMGQKNRLLLKWQYHGFFMLRLPVLTKSDALKFNNTIRKADIGAEERIPIFVSKSPPLRPLISSDKVKIPTTSKTYDMSARSALVHD